MSYNPHVLSTFTGVMHQKVDYLLALCGAELHLPAIRVDVF